MPLTAAKSLQRAFPEGEKIPKLLLDLLAFDKSSKDYYSGMFGIMEDGLEASLNWFADCKPAASRFVVFGTEAEDSLYAYWLYPDRTIATAPIVYLNSEGAGSTVISNSLREFLGLLGLGEEDLGFSVSHNSWAKDVEATPELERFRKWLGTKCKIAVPSSGKDLVGKAKRAHPDLGKWIRSWQTLHFS